MALFDKLKDSTLSLNGQPGPNFENETQRFTSNIQALAKNNNLVSSQDLQLGRTYGQAPNRTKVPTSVLDINGATPLKYVEALGSNNAGINSQFNSSTSTGFTLEKRLEFSQLGLKGQQGPNFENESQLRTSDVQALASNNILKSSQDLISGRKYGTGRFSVFVAPSSLDTNSNPFYPSLGGTNAVYKNKGPKEGRY
jgi:hypothetical protein